jgi:NADPH-dependent curcumin reductase CurA
MPQLMRDVLSKRLTLRGFIVSDFADQHAAFLRDVSGWIREGTLRYREDVAEGLETAPRTFLRLFRGENFGKLLVKVAE